MSSGSPKLDVMIRRGMADHAFREGYVSAGVRHKLTKVAKTMRRELRLSEEGALEKIHKCFPQDKFFTPETLRWFESGAYQTEPSQPQLDLAHVLDAFRVLTKAYELE